MLSRILRVALKPLTRAKAIGVRMAALRVNRELKISIRHRAALRLLRKAELQAPLRLNLGCGFNKKEGWTNVDLRKNADFRLDIRERWPFPDDSATLIYSEHLFEHLEYPDEVRHFLSESYRVLQPGGTLSTGVPDAEGIIAAYSTRNEEVYEYAKRKGWQPEWCDTFMHSVNYVFRQGDEHKYAYDFETLTRVLDQAGFTKVGRRPFNPQLDTEERRVGTLYVDARKPLRCASG